ncbi:hypothetical protein GH714_039196 [Hevea brasiliensis]|uniref:WAT1-related protein n=1 Tax=Hevea brasiliensis TaxID=3981 RepID=A0A6A6LMG5_HEVBR|nr:hypothetical protein GH714_039196 [Hevea brasiliensis]
MKLFLALFALQFCFSGFHIVSMVALNIGVSKVVYPVYRNIIALLLLGPFAYFLEKKERPPLTSSLLIQFFLLALLGITANQGFYLLGLNYGSPTFASAVQNTVPAITFVMASVLGLEQVNIARRDGLAKVVGTIASVVGATGIVASGIAFSLQTWCIQKGGPVFVAVFQPMQTLLVAIMASLILGDQLMQEGLLAILTMLGLYSVLWGKRREKSSSN